MISKHGGDLEEIHMIYLALTEEALVFNSKILGNFCHHSFHYVMKMFFIHPEWHIILSW